MVKSLNTGLNKAGIAKKDEFYTQLIDKEPFKIEIKEVPDTDGCHPFDFAQGDVSIHEPIPLHNAFL